MRCIYDNYLIFKLGNDDSNSQKKENPAWNETEDQLLFDTKINVNSSEKGNLPE